MLLSRTADLTEMVIEAGESIQNTLSSSGNHAYFIGLGYDQLLYEIVNQNSLDAGVSSLPRLTDLKDGWNSLYPGVETTCALGDDFHFWVRAAAPHRLVVYLYGGGACWDAETCDPEKEFYTYTHTIEPFLHPEHQSGIFDLDHPDNPVAEYSLVAVPVCTGDVHLGNRDVTYTLKTDSGETRQFTIHHRGQTNTMAAMDWIYANFESPQEIFVAGSSAGSIGTQFYASLLAQHYPEARVVGLGDDSGSYGSDASGPCPAEADQYSLRCAAVEVSQQLTGLRPEGYSNFPPALLDLIFTITDRLPDRQQGHPLGIYNNQPDTTVTDMIALLEEVRDRIRTSLAADGEQVLTE